jgi:hypothetical protein
MSIKKGQIEDYLGDIMHPETESSMVLVGTDTLDTVLASKAPLASPVLVGTPTAPTAVSGTSTTQIATTAFVNQAIINKTSISGNADTATRLQTARTISVSGDATGSLTFDGSANASMALTLSNNGVTAGTYFKTTVDSKGRVIDGSNPTTLSGFGITDAVLKATYTTAIDFNTITTPGEYNICVNACANNPNGNWGKLSVFYDNAVTIQLYYPDNTATIYKRTYSASTSVWSSWINLLSASNIGLGNVTNESKTTMFTNPALTGTPTAPTAASGTNTKQIATTEFVSTAISSLISSAPSTLDTLNELANALGDDPNFATSITNSIATKAPIVSPSFTGTVKTSNNTIDDSLGNASILGNLVVSHGAVNTTSQSGTIQLADATISKTYGGAFNFSSSITATGFNGSLNGNASTATKLQTARTIAISGGASGSATFDGSSNITINAIVNDIQGHTLATAGTYDTWGKIPVIGDTDGVLEIGKYLDFHIADGSTADYDVRLTAASGNIACSGSITATAFNGNASTSSKLQTARSISLTGDVSGSVNFDGSANASITTTVNSLRYFTSTNTANTYTGQYTKIASVSITSQYKDANAVLIVTNVGSGTTTLAKGTLYFRVKQQNAMGSAPGIDLKISNSELINENNFIAVITENSTSATTVELYYKAALSYDCLNFTQIINTGFNLYNSQSYLTALPTGTQYPCSLLGGVVAGTTLPDVSLRSESNLYFKVTG